MGHTANEAERDLIAEALCDPETRALVKLMGVLLPLNQRERADALNQVANKLDIDL